MRLTPIRRHTRFRPFEGWHAAVLRRSPRGKLLAAVVSMALLSACSTVVDGHALRVGDAPGSATGSAANGSGDGADQVGGSDTVGSHTGGSGADKTHRITVPPSAQGSGDTNGSGHTAGLDRFYSQQLDWGDCSPYATTAQEQGPYSSDAVECARLTVPLDYSDPDGDTITVGVLRHQATGDKTGSVVFNPGGPGASGMSIVAQLAVYGIAPALAKHFDFVGFDPRGVDSSEPHIACQTDAERDHDRVVGWPGFMASATSHEVDAANEQSKAFIQGCLTKISAQGVDAKAFLANVGTANVARDLDVLRAALGDKKLTYVGWSYGTSIGTHYAEQFPDHVRALILDGAINPALTTGQDSLQQTKGFQTAFEHFAQWCAERDGCPWQDASKANRRFQAMAQPLMDTPLTLSDGRTFSFLDAVMGVADALYVEATWPALLQALNAFAHGDATGLMTLADEYYQRDNSGHYSGMLDAFNAIRCMDSNRITDPDAMTALNKKLVAASPFQDNGQPPAAIFDVCAFWPVAPTTLPHTPDPEGLPQVLVISTTSDPATPYKAGVALAKDLGARLLTVKGTHHTSYMLSGLQCVNKIGTHYLLTLELPDDGATCPS